MLTEISTKQSGEVTVLDEEKPEVSLVVMKSHPAGSCSAQVHKKHIPVCQTEFLWVTKNIIEL